MTPSWPGGTNKKGFETNKKSPTKRFGFMEPEGILNGSIAKVLITPAISNAHKRAFRLFIKELLNLLKYHRRN